MTGRAITARRVEQVAAAIKSTARFARTSDPFTKGRVSYASFCGGLEAIIVELAREAGGQDAAAVISAAFVAAFDDSTAEARDAIAKAKATVSQA